MPDTPPSTPLGTGLKEVDEALAVVLSACQVLPPEKVNIDRAVGRCLAQAVVAQRTLPPRDNSAMDGYAVRSADVQQAGARLQIVERIFAGQAPRKALQAGQCARIMTGGFLPEGADAVVMQERTRAVDSEQVEMLEIARPRANVRDEGEDSRAGAPLMQAGTALGLPEAGLLWGQGLVQVEVPRRPRVFIAASGDELTPVGAGGVGVVDTNSPSLCLAVERAGGQATALGVAGDSLAAVTGLLGQGLSGELLLTVAGVSVGEHDFVRAAMEQLGVEILFHGVAMKPAKPVLFGRRGSSLVFGLPGNPTSALVAFELLVRPALRALQGLPPHWPVLPGRLAVPFKKAAGLRHFVRVSTEVAGGALVATPLKSQTSGALSSAAGASFLMSVPSSVTTLAAGDQIDLIPVTWGPTSM